MAEFILAAAVALNGVIGHGGQLPWRLPADMTRFKALTAGKTVLMGRKTFESLPPVCRTLPNRKHVVLTRQPQLHLPQGVRVIHNLTELEDEPEVWVLGGAEVFALCLPLARRIELIHIHVEPDGEALFPRIDPADWQEEAYERYEGDPAYALVTYTRRATEDAEPRPLPPLKNPTEPEPTAPVANAAA